MRRHTPLLLLSLLLILFAAPTISQAARSGAQGPAKGPTTPHLAPRDADAEEEFEGEEEEFDFEECEAANSDFGFEFELEEEGEAAEEEEWEIEVEECEEEVQKKAGAVTAPEACRVRSAESSITTLPNSDRVQLAVKYVTYQPSTVSLGLKMKDGKGSLKLESTTKHLGKQGTLHLTTKLTDAEMERAARAEEFAVSLRAPKTPGFCGNLLEQKLDAKHPVGNARVYTQRVNG